MPGRNDEVSSMGWLQIIPFSFCDTLLALGRELWVPLELELVVYATLDLRLDLTPLSVLSSTIIEYRHVKVLLKNGTGMV